MRLSDLNLRSCTLRQMAANRLYEDLQLLQPLRHQQHCQPRRQHKDQSTKKGRFEEGKQLFHCSGYFTRLIGGGAWRPAELGNSPGVPPIPYSPGSAANALGLGAYGTGDIAGTPSTLGNRRLTPVYWASPDRCRGLASVLGRFY
jgi:hypothetical protein